MLISSKLSKGKNESKSQDLNSHFLYEKIKKIKEKLKWHHIMITMRIKIMKKYVIN